MTPRPTGTGTTASTLNPRAGTPPGPWCRAGALVPRWGRVSGFGNRPGYTRTGAPRGLAAAPARAAAQRLITAKQRRRYQVVAQGQLCVDTVPAR